MTTRKAILLPDLRALETDADREDVAFHVQQLEDEWGATVIQLTLESRMVQGGTDDNYDWWPEYRWAEPGWWEGEDT